MAINPLQGALVPAELSRQAIDLETKLQDLAALRGCQALTLGLLLALLVGECLL
jgi:hypothetical protein